jgi:NAD+ kinase
MKIALLGSFFQEEKQIKKIFRILSDHQVDICIENDFKDYLFSNFNIETDVSVFVNDNFDADFIFSIGGDGTFLKTVATTGYKNIPILGINTGRLGFLADINEENLEDTLLELLAGQYRIEERTQLELSSQEDFFNGRNLALNEIAILKQDTASMITVHASINNEYLASYQADGLIISTPTGSTAYSLSVGGPIMSPSSNSFIIAAIAPHSLNSRPLVIEDNSTLTLEIESRNRNFLISLDGRSEVMSSCSLLTVKKANTKIKLVKRVGHTFYGTLREKLMWGTDPRNNKR